MTGLEKMKSQILEEAKANADGQIAEAKAQAERILEEAKAETLKSVESISQKSKIDVANYQDRVKSSLDLQKRNKILQAKQDLIHEILDKAYEKLEHMETGEYFEIILKLVEKYALAQDGMICFGKADLERMPEGFREKVKQAAAAKGGALSLSEEGRNIKNGFVLVYGGIEENCTLRAIFDAKKEEMADQIHRLLF